MDRQGELVGSADPVEVSSALNGGAPAEVYQDGDLVGHFGPSGFVPVEKPNG